MLNVAWHGMVGVGVVETQTERTTLMTDHAPLEVEKTAGTHHGLLKRRWTNPPPHARVGKAGSVDGHHITPRESTAIIVTLQEGDPRSS